MVSNLSIFAYANEYQDDENVILADSESEEKTYTATSHIDQFGEYDVKVTVKVKDDVITDIEVTGENFSGTYADYNQTKLQTAYEGLKNSYIGKSSTDAQGIYDVDAVLSATYSSNAIRDAILSALELAIDDEEITLPTQKLEEGTYSVDIAYYTDVVKHSLIENETGKAIITVDSDGNMTLDTDIINGTSKEPLYVTDFVGYYGNNDLEQELKKDAVVTTETVDFDSVGEKSVVTNVKFPLEGDFAKIYNTRTKIYVPSMKNLNGNISGIEFENGVFAADSFVNAYWDSIQKVQQTGFGSGNVELKAGKYTVPVSMKNASNINNASMVASAIKGGSLEVLEDGSGKLTVDLQAVTVGNISDWASDWKVYTGDSAKGDTITPETVTDEDGHVTQITFTIPDKSKDGLYVNMYISAMGYNPDAYFAIDYANAEAVKEVSTVLGDVDCDGSVTINDASLLLDYVLNSTGVEITEAGLKNALVLGNDIATATDVSAILQKALNSDYKFPIEK